MIKKIEGDPRAVHQLFRDHDIFPLGGMNALMLYHRGRMHEVPQEEKLAIDDGIIDGTNRSILGYSGKRERADRMALASYPLVDLWSPIDRRCNWIVLTAKEPAITTNGGVEMQDKHVATILQYQGEHNIRYFPYGSKRHVVEFMREWSKTENGLGEQEEDDETFRVVLPAWQFAEEELDSLVGFNWELREKPEIITRIVNPIKDNVPPSVTIPEGFQIVDLTSSQVPQVREMLDKNYPHHSFHSHRNHKGIVDLNTGEVVAISGIVGRATPPELPPITLTGNLVTDSRYRGRGLASAARIATLQDIKADPVYGKGIVVADVIKASEGINLGLGFRRIPVGSAAEKLGFAKFYWCIYQPK